MLIFEIQIMSNCIFCKNTSFINSPFENTVFNNKRFQYITCSKCHLVQVDPLPNEDDLVKMYAMDYYSFKKLQPSSIFDAVLSEIKGLGEYKTVLDFGCGGGRFLVNALDKGYVTTGVDFGDELIGNLKEAYPSANFIEISEFNKQSEKYDVIYVSNVFEHLTNPVEVLNQLYDRLNVNGILVSDGPAENNFTIAGAFRKCMFGIRKFILKKEVNHVPRHITYTNKANQLSFFERSGLKTVSFRLEEAAWPFPSDFKSAVSIILKMYFVIAKISIFLGRLIPNNGNVFYFIGRKTS